MANHHLLEAKMTKNQIVYMEECTGMMVDKIAE